MTMAFLLYFGAGTSSIYDISLTIILLVSVPNVLAFALSFFVKKLPSWGPIAGMCFGFLNSAIFMFVPKIAAAFPESAFLAGWAEWLKSLMWHHKMFINCIATIIPTLGSVFFWNDKDEEYKARVDKFFKNLNTPVDFKAEVGESADTELLKIVGGLGLVMAGAIGILAFFAPDHSGVMAVLFIVACIGAVSGFMYYKGRKAAAAAIAVNNEE